MAFYWACVLGMAALALHLNQGQFTYVLDDAYIHLAMAKNAVLSGAWGMTAEGFTSTSSSPLWTGMLAGFFWLFGISDSYPLWLNLVFGSAALIAAGLLLARTLESKWLQLGVLVGLVLVTPMPALALSGMEHSLHLLLSVLFLWLAADLLAGEGAGSRRKRAWLWLLAPLLVATRYEGLFLLLAAGVLFLVKKRWVDALAVTAGGLLPVLAYGLVSLGQGWFFLPNSVLLKGRLPVFTAEGVLRLLGYNAFEQLKNNGFLLILCLAALGCCLYGLWRRGGLPGFREVAALIYLGSLLLHLQFAQTGWFYRYEAYLVFLGILLAGLYTGDILNELRQAEIFRKYTAYLALGMLGLLLALPFVERAGRAFLTTSQAMNNIYEQQYQMARFVREYYAGQALALNDIGAVSYLSEIRLLDLWGLASLEVAQAKLERAYGPERIAGLAGEKGVRIAIVYDLFFQETGGLPRTWEKVGEWRIRDNRVCASDTVAFYAIVPEARDELKRRLNEFREQLPAEVEQSGAYLEEEGGS